MLSIPVAVHIDKFSWQLDLFWHAHKAVYGANASQKALAAIVTKNTPNDPEATSPVGWGLEIPFVVAPAYFERLHLPHEGIKVPLNIQVALQQAIAHVEPEQVIEVLDCDMFHFKPAPELDVPPDVLYVSTLYEDWHLKSLTDHKSVISPYFENDGRYYNGGFVPIIGRASTFAKLLPEWIAIHVDILSRNFGTLDSDIHWWAGMYALQAACEKAKVTMIARDFCFIPPANTLSSEHYIAHYSVDPLICKKTFPQDVKLSRFPDQEPYNLFKQWFTESRLGSLT